jgi:hypothetical protein
MAERSTEAMESAGCAVGARKARPVSVRDWGRSTSLSGSAGFESGELGLYSGGDLVKRERVETHDSGYGT